MKVLIREKTFSWEPMAILIRPQFNPVTKGDCKLSRIMLCEQYVGATAIGDIYQSRFLYYHQTGSIRPAHYPYLYPALKKEVRKMHRISCLLLTATKWNAVKKFYRQHRRQYYGSRPDII